MPDDVFRKQGQRVVDHLMSMKADARQEAIVTNWSQRFVERSGDLGAAAIPFLRWVAFDVGLKFEDPSAFRGLCRAGAVAAPLAERLLADIIRLPRSKRAEAAEIAIFRMGRGDLLTARAGAGFDELAIAVRPDSDPLWCGLDRNQVVWRYKRQ